MVWSLLLVPYGWLVAVVLGGAEASRTYFDGLGTGAFIWPVYVIAALPVNLAAAVFVRRLVLHRVPAVRMLLAIILFGLLWFFAIQVLFLPVFDLNHGLLLDGFTIAAAVAGGAYGLGLMVPGRPRTG